jgi:hypothetical protein
MKKFAAGVIVLALSAGPLMAGVPVCGQPGTPNCPSTVPEPATMALLAGGAVLLGATAWRRRKNR